MWAILHRRVSKAVQSKKNATSNKARPPYKQARANPFKESCGSSKPRILSSHEHQPFWRAPFREKREPARDYPDQSRYKIPRKKTSNGLQGKLSRYDFLLSPTQTYLVVEEIRNLLQKGAILEVPFNPMCYSTAIYFLWKRRVKQDNVQ